MLLLQDIDWNTYEERLVVDQWNRIPTPLVDENNYEVVPLWVNESLWVYSDGWCMRELWNQECMLYVSKYWEIDIQEPRRYRLEAEVYLDTEINTATVVLRRDELQIGEITFIYTS